MRCLSTPGMTSLGKPALELVCLLPDGTSKTQLLTNLSNTGSLCASKISQCTSESQNLLTLPAYMVRAHIDKVETTKPGMALHVVPEPGRPRN